MKIFPLLFGLSVIVSAAHAGLTKDIEYTKPNGVSVKLDACTPDGAGPFPAAILVHGGGWSGGDKAVEIDPLFAPLTKAGIAWFSINYRLSPDNPYPACVDDTEAAVRWVKAHAKEYNLDVNKIVLIGESAGGHIVDMVAVRATKDKPDTRVAAVVAFYAPCDNVADSIRRGGPSPSMQKLLGLPAEKLGDDGKLSEKTTKLLYDISPLNFVHKDLPPYLLVHGTADTSVPYEQSPQWQAKLKALGVPCDLITIPGGPHVMGRWETIDPTYKDQTIAWLVKTLGLGKTETPAKPPAKPLTAAEKAALEKKNIELLIVHIEKLDGATFIRNGSNYTPKEAGAHLRDKLKAAGSAIKTARDFIDLIASSSSASGEMYRVKLKDGTIVPSGDLLKKELKQMEAGS